MAETNVPVTGGSGHNLHAWDRTIGATLVKDQFVLPGEYPYASYEVHARSISIGTANDHVLQLMAGSSAYVRIRRIRIEQFANATTAQATSILVMRLTTAGTGGTSVTPRPFDAGDAAAGATAMTLPTVKGTEGVELDGFAMVWRQAISATQAQIDDAWEWTQLPGQKPLIIPAGTANGIAIKSLSAVTTATVNVKVEFVETAWLGA